MLLHGTFFIIFHSFILWLLGPGGGLFTHRSNLTYWAYRNRGDVKPDWSKIISSLGETTVLTSYCVVLNPSNFTSVVERINQTLQNLPQQTHFYLMIREPIIHKKTPFKYSRKQFSFIPELVIALPLMIASLWNELNTTVQNHWKKSSFYSKLKWVEFYGMAIIQSHWRWTKCLAEGDRNEGMVPSSHWTSLFWHPRVCNRRLRPSGTTIDKVENTM